MFVDQSNAVAPRLTSVTLTAVDLGGDYGCLSPPLVTSHPSMRGVILGLPRAAPGARDCWTARSVSIHRWQLLRVHPRGRPPPVEARAAGLARRRCLTTAVSLRGRGRAWRSPVDRRLAHGRNPTSPTRPSLPTSLVLLVLRGGRDRTEDECESWASNGVDRHHEGQRPERHRSRGSRWRQVGRPDDRRRGRRRDRVACVVLVVTADGREVFLAAMGRSRAASTVAPSSAAPRSAGFTAQAMLQATSDSRPRAPRAF